MKHIYTVKVLYYTHTSQYHRHRVKAEYFTLKDGAYLFYDQYDNFVFSSPVNVTVIEKVEDNETIY